MSSSPPTVTPSRTDGSDRNGVSFAHLAQLIRLPNQSGTLLLMLPSLWALVLASHGRPEPSLLVIFALGAFLMRSAGVTINDLVDRSIDRRVERTKRRPLARGALSVSHALLVMVVLLLIAAGLLLFLNPLVALLSPVAILLAGIYPFAKRFIQVPQLVLGVAFGWGVVMAWAAVRHTLEPPTWLVFGATILWALAYDTIYALQDREDDLRIGVKSSAILFGSWTWVAVGVSFAGMLGLVALAGWWLGLGPLFYGVLPAVAGFLIRQVLRLRSHVQSELAFTLFKQHIWVGWAILGGIWLGCLYPSIQAVG